MRCNPTPATPDNPRWVTNADIKFFERCNPDQVGAADKMLEMGIWRLTDDPHLSGQLVDPIAMPARGRC